MKSKRKRSLRVILMVVFLVTLLEGAIAFLFSLRGAFWNFFENLGLYVAYAKKCNVVIYLENIQSIKNIFISVKTCVILFNY